MVDLDSDLRDSRIGNSMGTASITDIGVRDMDGDGNMDVITAGAGGVLAYYVDNADNLDSIQPVRITPAASLKAMAFGDFDRDGRLDVAVAVDSRAVIFYRNEGNRSAFDAHRRVSGLRTIALASADMDGDGDLDLVLAERKGRDVEIHLNDGRGNFSLQANAVPTTNGANRALGVGDLNGDRNMDIVLAKAEGLNVFYLSDGNGGFLDGQLLNQTGNKVDYRDIALGDVNNDGHLDILVGVHKAQNILYLNNGNGGFGMGSRINNSGARTTVVELADMDGDGDLDIVEGKGNRIYLNQGGTFGLELPVGGKANTVAVGDVDGNGDLALIYGKTAANLEIARLTERRRGSPSTTRLNTGHGRVVSGKVNGDEDVPHIVFLTATAVQQEHTDIEYYLSNDGGRRWLRAYPGRSVRFPAQGDDLRGNDLRWRAELKSRSPVKTPTLTRISIESVLQVFIDGDVFSNGQTYTETTHTITAEFKSTTATIRLMNRGEQALTVTGVETVGQVFGLQDGQGQPLPHPLAESMEIEGSGNGEDIRLVFNPVERGTYASTLTISGSEGGRVLPDIKVMLRGRGIGAEINIPESSLVLIIEARVGTSKSDIVEIENNGETPLTITSATVPDSVFSLIEPALPTTLTVSEPARNFKFRFKPKAPGTTATTITFISNAFNGAVTRTLTGKGVAPVISVEHPVTGERIESIDFGGVREGGRTTGEVVIRNTGDWAMNISAVTGTDTVFDLVFPTTASINENGLMVAEGTSETVVFSFTPQMGRRSSPTADIIFTSDAFNDTQTEVMLRGRGTAPEVDFDKSQQFPVDFGGVRVGESDTRTVVIENTGDEPLIVSGVRSKTMAADVRGLFSWVPPFPGAVSQTVAAEATATLTLRFTPRIRRDAAFTDTLMIDSDAVNMTEKFLTVEGQGIAPVMAVAVTGTGLIKPMGSTAAVALHDFGDVPIEASTSREIYISNDGTAPLEVALSLVGGRGFRWESTPDGVITMGRGQSAADLEPAPNLVLHFQPEDREPDTARLIFRDTRNNLHTTYTLTGRGTEVEMELRVGDGTLAEGATHTFSDTKVNTSKTVIVEVHNHGNVPMNISTPTLARVGDLTGFSLVESGGLPDTVPEGGSASFTFRFQPTAPGTATALVTFASDAVNAVNATRTMIFLQGRGIAPMISVTPTGTIRFGEVRAGTSTDRHVTITNTGDAVLEVTSAKVVNGGAAELLFSVVSPAQFPHPVGVGEELVLTVRFSPLEPMESNLEGVLVIGSDASNRLDKHPQVSGKGVVSVMAVIITNTGVRKVNANDDSTPLHDFGDVPINTSASRRVFISNQRGGAPLRVEIPSLSGAVPFRWENDSVPEVIVVEDGESTSGLVLVFEPEEVGPASTTLTFVSDTFENATQTVTLKGRGRGKPRMEVEIAGSVRQHEGDPYRFNPQRVGTTEGVAVTISNRGNDDLVIESIATTAATLAPLVRHNVNDLPRLHPPASERYRPGYSISDSHSRTIEAGSSTVVMLHFSPSLPSREDNALLTVNSNDPEHPDWVLGLKGSGTGPMLSITFPALDGTRRFRGYFWTTSTTSFYDMGEAIAYDKRRMSVEQPRVPFLKAVLDTKFSRPQPRNHQHIYWRIHNWGNENLEITHLDMEEGSTGFRRYHHWNHIVRNLAPNHGAGGGVTFVPVGPGVHTGTFVIRSSDVTLPELRVEFKAKGIAPGIDVQADDFGNVPIGGSSTARVVVRNDGDAPLTISGVGVDDSNQFSVNTVFSDFPVVLSDEDTPFVFDVSFAPVELGISTAALIILSDAFRESTYTVVLQSGGVEPETSFGVQVGGQVMGAQTTFAFGRVRAGMTTAVTVAVENRGSSVLNIEPLLSGAGYSLANSDTRVIAPNSSGSWVLRFHPENSGSHDGMLDIVNANNHSELFRRLNLMGSGVKSGIQVEIANTVYQSETGHYSFGKIEYGTSRTAEVTITNTGDAALNIKLIGVTPGQLEYSIHYNWYEAGISTRYRKVDTGYSLVGNDIQMIPADSSASFTLHFTPVIPVANNGVLKIVSDNPEHPEWNLNLAGRGTGPFLDVSDYYYEEPFLHNSFYMIPDIQIGTSVRRPAFLYINLGDSFIRRTRFSQVTGESFSPVNFFPLAIRPGYAVVGWHRLQFRPIRRGIHTGTYTIHTNDRINPTHTLRLQANAVGPAIDVTVNSSAVVSGGVYDFGDVPVGGSSQTHARVDNNGDGKVALGISNIVVDGGNGQFDTKADLSLSYPLVIPHEADSWSFDVSFAPTRAGPVSARLIIRNNAYGEKTYTITLRGNGVAAPSAWAGGVQRPAIPTFTEIESDISAPRFVGLGYADWQSRLWLAFDEPAQILSGTDARVLADGAALSGFKVLANYTGGGAVEDIGVLRAGYRSGGVVMDLARGIVPADASLWARYTPPSDGVSGIYDLAVPPNRISSVRLFMLPRSAVLDYDGDGFPDALEARLGGNPLVADDVVGLPEVALLREGAVGSPAAVAYSGIRADGVAAHMGVVTTGTSSLTAYYLSDTFGYSGGYAENVGGYGCTGRFPSDYASPLSEGGCAVVDFNSIRAGVEHRIGWLATNAAGYWAIAQGTTSRLPEQVILRVPEFNMKRRNVFVGNSAAADETVVVAAFHDGPASLPPLTVSFGNVAAADSRPSSSEPDGFSVSVAGVTTDTTSYTITGVHSGEAGKLWLAGDPLSSLTPDKYSLGKVTQTDVVRLTDDNLPPLFGRASLYVGSTADENERHAVMVRGTENYIALLPVVHGSAQTASAFEVSPWDGAGGGPVAADDRVLAVNAASPVADGALVRIAFTASSPPATVRNTVSLEVAASSAGADTATTVLTWPMIDSADALASIAGDSDNDGIPDVRDNYPLLNRLPISVAGGVSGYPGRSSAGADGWHHIRPLSPLHSQHVGGYATRAGLSFSTRFAEGGLILGRLYITTPEQQTLFAADYQPGIPIQMNYADFAASLSHDEFGAMARQQRQDIAVVYNFRLHGVEPSVAQNATLAGGRAGVVIPLPESLHDHTNILPLHYTNGAWSGFSTDPGTPATAGFAPLQAGACPDDSGVAGNAYRTASGTLNTHKRTGDACMVLYLTDGAAADRDGNINGVVDALIGLAAITLLR